MMICISVKMKDFLLQYKQKVNQFVVVVLFCMTNFAVAQQLLVGNSDSSPALDSYYNHNGSTGNSSYSTSKDELLRAQRENNTNGDELWHNICLFTSFWEGNINPVNLATLLKDTTLGSYLTVRVELQLFVTEPSACCRILSEPYQIHCAMSL